MKVLELFAGTRSIGKAFEARRQKILNEHWDALDRGEIQPGPCASPAEVMRGGWRFLYFVDYYGDWNTECFTVCGRNAATEKGGTGNV